MRPRNPGQTGNQGGFNRPNVAHNASRPVRHDRPSSFIGSRYPHSGGDHYHQSKQFSFQNQSPGDQNGTALQDRRGPHSGAIDFHGQPPTQHAYQQTNMSFAMKPEVRPQIPGVSMQYGNYGQYRTHPPQASHNAASFHESLDNAVLTRHNDISRLNEPMDSCFSDNGGSLNSIKQPNNNQFIDSSSFKPSNVNEQKKYFRGDQDKVGVLQKFQDSQPHQQMHIPGLDMLNQSSGSFVGNTQSQFSQSSVLNVPHKPEPKFVNMQSTFTSFQNVPPQISNFQDQFKPPNTSVPPPQMPFLNPNMQQMMNPPIMPINRTPVPLAPPNFSPEGHPFPNKNQFQALVDNVTIHQSTSQSYPQTGITADSQFNVHVHGTIRHSQPYQANRSHLELKNTSTIVNNKPISEKDKDKQWINDWLVSKGGQKMKKCMPVPNNVNICDVQEKTKRMMFLMASLQKQIRVLSACDSIQFTEEMKTADRLKEEMNTIRKYLSTVNIEKLKKKVKRQKHKRERMKKQRQEKYLCKQEELEHRNQLHKEIDERLNKIYKQDADKRQAKELKKTADKILSEVRKKTQDITRATDLLKNLKKLRKLRKDRLLQQGVQTKPETDVDFDDKIQSCLSVLSDQKEVYNAENRALRVMLETEQEENKEKEREKMKQIIHSQEMKKEKKIYRLLFGNTEPCDVNDPMFVFNQYYDQANLSLDSLIQIRCDWDRFCVSEGTPGGSRIPDGYVIPQKPSSDIWASALKEES